MRGRLENKMRIETSIQEKIANAPEYIKKYYYYLSKKSHTTKRVYIENVLRFLNYVSKGEEYPSLSEVSNVDEFTIQMYVSEIGYYTVQDEIHELKETSQGVIYSSLSSFFSFLVRSEYIKTNPFENNRIDRPKMKENSVTYLTPEEVRKVESQILNGTGNARSVGKQRDWKYRDLLLFRIPVVNGLRVTALSEINVEDIDLVNRKILVTEKGNITKSVDFDSKTGNYLKIWLKQRALLNNGIENGPLFISNRRTRMTVRSIENVVEKYTTCIDKHITPHKLRSTCGTNTYQATKDIYLVSKILGHKNTSPTKRYAAVLDEDRVNTINKVAELY